MAHEEKAHRILQCFRAISITLITAHLSAKFLIALLRILLEIMPYGCFLYNYVLNSWDGG